MSDKLNKITTEYRKFSKGQYVDHKQFNAFLDYFEDQTRLSRLTLSGVGIACGLEYQPIYYDVYSRRDFALSAVSNIASIQSPEIQQISTLSSVSSLSQIAEKRLSKILVSQGIGVTTDGDLITLKKLRRLNENDKTSLIQDVSIKSKTYAYYKAYDNTEIGYAPFFDANTSTQIPLVELATADEIEGLNGFAPIQSMANEYQYLIAYVESYEKEEKPCRGVDCDNHGEVQVANLKLLLTTFDGIKNIMANDTVYKRIDSRSLYEDLPDISVKRLFFDEESLTPRELQDKYEAIVKDADLIDTIEMGFEAITDQFDIANSFNQNGYGLSQLIDVGLAKHSGFQYCYDFVKELVETYTEIKTLLPAFSTLCFADIKAFSKHLMLGDIEEPSTSSLYRHGFYNAAILDEDDIANKIKLLIQRFNQQVLKFNIVDTEALDDPLPIRVVPSKAYGRLGTKAVPFYYAFEDDLLKKWDYSTSKHKTWSLLFGYDAPALAGTDIPEVYADMANDTFYRIEGHQGADLVAATSQINRQKNKYQLPFDVMALSLETLGSNDDESKAYFFDYIKKHPGISHTGGVPKGGTFIMVYQSEDDKKVIADFTLPYSCCGQNKKVGLIIPESVCAVDEPFQMNVEPVNGVVKAFVDDVEVLEIPKTDDKTMFDPSHSAFAGHYGTPIQFTVNDKAISAELTINDEPDVSIAVSDLTVLDETVEVSFLVTNNDGDEYTYSWDFLGTGNEEEVAPDVDNKVTHVFAKGLNPKPVIKVTITRSEGCPKTISFSDWYDVFRLNSVAFSGQPSCCNRAPISVQYVRFLDGVNCCSNDR